MELKVYDAILHTSNKVLEDEKEIEFWNTLDGIKVFVGEGFDTKGIEYCLICCQKESEETYKDAIYLMEQDPVFGNYINDRKRFEKDWENGDYDSGGFIYLDKSEVEILGVLGKGKINPVKGSEK